MPGIAPMLWFDTQAEEAARYYTSIFPNSKVTAVSHYGESGPRPAGTVLTVAFELDGQPFTALNGGPEFSFSEAISFVIDCKDQEEVDYYWAKLSEGGLEHNCGWVKDRFGLWWQVVPTELPSLIGDPDPGRAQRAMQAMLQMHKLDIATLRAAADSVPA